MPNLLVWTVGDLMPSISDTITIDGVPFNLSASSVVFKMRAVGSSTLKVNSPGVIVSPANLGGVRYDWNVADVDTAGNYLCWWEVTTSGAVQSVNEALIQFRAHSPLAGYVELEEMRSTLSLNNAGQFLDIDIQNAIASASRAIEQTCQRVFTKDATNTNYRYFDPSTTTSLILDDIVDLQEVAIDTGGNLSYSTILSSSQYDLGPYNNPVNGWPYEWLRVRPQVTQGFFPYWSRSIRVKGQWGWPSVPAPIKDATAMLAHRYLRRKREAPFAIVSTGAPEGHGLMRIASTDPDVFSLIKGYSKSRPFI